MLVGSAAFAWNPLILLESAGNGHNDILMVFFLLLAVYFAASDRPWLVIPALVLSISTKFVPVLVFPFFLLYLIRREETWRRRLTVAVGNLEKKAEFDLQQLIARELTFTGSYASAGEFSQCIDPVASGKINVEPLISEILPLKEGPGAFDRLLKAEEDLLKIVLEP